MPEKFVNNSRTFIYFVMLQPSAAMYFIETIYNRRMFFVENRKCKQRSFIIKIMKIKNSITTVCLDST